MGIYGDYLNSPVAGNFDSLTVERKRQLARISALRGGRDVLVFAADLNKDNAGVSIGYVDILPISDQLASLQGKSLDLILETPGGSGEVAEDIVRILRAKYEDIAVIVPGWAKSAGTIMAMAGDEILMGITSALGPIDAQLYWQGKRFSADALLHGLEKIKQEVQDSGETPTSQIYKFVVPAIPPQAKKPGALPGADVALLDVQCNACQTHFQVQANIGSPKPIKPGAIAFPADNKVSCPKCGVVTDLSDARREIEAQAKKPVV